MADVSGRAVSTVGIPLLGSRGRNKINLRIQLDGCSVVDCSSICFYHSTYQYNKQSM